MSVQNITTLWHQSLYRNSLWEYALALRAMRKVFGNRRDLRVADYGYDMGFPPTLLWLGYDLTLVELWRRAPEEENFMLEHLRRVKERRTTCVHEPVGFWQKSLGVNGLPEEKKFDVVFSLSMLPKMGDIEGAFEDMCGLVKEKGMLFVTTSEEDRELPVRQFDRKMYESLLTIALKKGFKLLDGLVEWDWENRENSFISMALTKGEIG